MYSHLYSVCTPRTSRCTPHMTCTLHVLYVLHVALRKYTQSTDRVHCTLHGPWEYIQSTWRILKYRVHNRVHNTVHQEYISKYRTPYPDESTFTVHKEYTPEYGTATPPSPCPNPPQSTHRVRSRVRTEYSRNAVECKSARRVPPPCHIRGDLWFQWFISKLGNFSAVGRVPLEYIRSTGGVHVLQKHNRVHLSTLEYIRPRRST